MVEHKQVSRLKITNRTPNGGEISTMRCGQCGEVIRSPGPGEPYKCRCGWSMQRPIRKPKRGEK